MSGYIWIVNWYEKRADGSGKTFRKRIEAATIIGAAIIAQMVADHAKEPGAEIMVVNVDMAAEQDVGESEITEDSLLEYEWPEAREI